MHLKTDLCSRIKLLLIRILVFEVLGKFSQRLLGFEGSNDYPQWLAVIQGDGRKFLDRFKSYFGSQISSPSLNDADYSQKPEQKVIFFPYIFVVD